MRESMADTNSNNVPVSPKSVELSIPFETAELALVAYNSLRVDKEPKRSSTFKTFYITDNCLKVRLESPETRQLRTATNTFLDHLLLVTKTFDVFGPTATVH